jgi:hypothetical protein
LIDFIKMMIQISVKLIFFSLFCLLIFIMHL